MRILKRSAQLGSALSISIAMTNAAQSAGTIEIDEDSFVSIGGGLRAGFSTTDDGAPSGMDDSSSFSLDSARLYVSGQATENVKFTFNTECNPCMSSSGDVLGEINVLDAIAQLEFSPQVNIWIGRMLTPADRIEMNGPYYGLSWNQFNVPLLPSDGGGGAGGYGRDEGVTFWGSSGKFQYAAGLFDGVDGGPNQEDNMLFSARFAYNFLSMESNPGYYTSSTYFGGGGDIFTLGLSLQSQSDAAGVAGDASDFSAVILDWLYENPLESGGVVTIEGEYKSFDSDVSAGAAADPDCFCFFDGTSYFATFAYMFAGDSKVRYQPYVRLVTMSPDGGADTDLTEIGMNFVINGHNARLNLNYTDSDSPSPDTLSFGVQVQI